MSEGTHWIAIAIIAAVILSWGGVVWRKRQHLKRAKTADDSDRIEVFLQKHFMPISVIALGLAGLAQYALRIDQPGLAALGYWFAVILFTNGLRQFIPIKLIGEAASPTVEPEPNLPNTFEVESAPLTMTEPIAASGIIPANNSEIVSEVGSPTLDNKASLEEIVSTTHPTVAANTEPILASGIIPTDSSEVVSEAKSPTLDTKASLEEIVSTTHPIEEVNTESVLASGIIPADNSEVVSEAESPTVDTKVSFEEIVSATHPTEVVNNESLPKTAVFSVWSGFTQPDSILLTAQEQLLILDSAQQILYRLNTNGQIVQQWSLPPLPEPNGRNLVLSPDGRRLYITDAQKGLVYAITLED
jgi:hypothetical protein